MAVDPSSLSKANENRDYRIFEELGMWLIRKVRPMYAKADIPDVYLPGWEIFAIDSTTVKYFPSCPPAIIILTPYSHDIDPVIEECPRGSIW